MIHHTEFPNTFTHNGYHFDLPYPYQAYHLKNFRKIPQIEKYLTEEQRFSIEVVGSVLPFKANSYVVKELIDWDSVPNDPIFILTFPQKGMLLPRHFDRMATLLRGNAGINQIKQAAREIRMELNPHPAGQLTMNVPKLKGERLPGIQHKYRETTLFFPSQGQTCHAYCTFCFRWPQFVGMHDFRFAMKEGAKLVEYLKAHPEVTDVLFTGGDPMIMKPALLGTYLRALIHGNIPSLKNIRIGTKSLSYWPYRYTNDDSTPETLDLFREVTASGINLAFMAHFNHLNELKTEVVKQAVRNILDTGANIRTQSPVLTRINDKADMWADMWEEQVRMGMVPYYMFIVRDTGAQHYFGITLERAWKIYQKAITQVSGISRTVRGPSMSALPGKVEISGITEVNGEKFFVLRFLQGRNPDWCFRPFLAKYDPEAIWLNDLKPAFGKKEFFYQRELAAMKKFPIN